MKWLEFIRRYISKLIICKSSVGIGASSKKYCIDLHISGVPNLPKALFLFTFVNSTKILVFSILTNLYFFVCSFPVEKLQRFHWYNWR